MLTCNALKLLYMADQVADMGNTKVSHLFSIGKCKKILHVLANGVIGL